MTAPRRLSEAALAAIGEQAEKATPGPWEMTVRTDRSEDTFYTVRTVEKHPDHPWSQRYVSWLNGTLRNRERPRYRYCETCKHGHYDHQEVGSEIRDDHCVGDDAAFIAAARSAVPALLAHAAYLAEQLAEAERDAETERNNSATIRANLTYSLAGTATLMAQLARERADHAATVARQTERISQLEEEAQVDEAVIEHRTQQRDTEKAARLAAEGQVAELRSIAEVVASPHQKLYDTDRDDGILGCVPIGLIRRARGALAATPLHGAAAVLAADQDDHLSKAYLQLVRLIERADNAADQQGDDDFVYFYNMPCGPWHKVIGAIRKTIADNAMDYDQEATNDR